MGTYIEINLYTKNWQNSQEAIFAGLEPSRVPHPAPQSNQECGHHYARVFPLAYQGLINEVARHPYQPKTLGVMAARNSPPAGRAMAIAPAARVDGWEMVPCASCGPDAPSQVLWPQREKGDIRRCLRCGLTYRSPRRGEAWLANYFAETWMGDEPAWQGNSYKRYLNSILRQILVRHPAAGALLDVGAGHGLFLQQVPETWQRFGLDPSPRACQAAKALLPEAQIIQGTLQDAWLPDRFFDVVTMITTVYYLPHPLQDLVHCRELLKPGGMLAVHSLNFANRGHLYRLLQRAMPETWLYFFTPRTLTKLLEKAGFIVTEQINLPAFHFSSWGRCAGMLARAEFYLTSLLKYLTRGRLDLVPHFLLLAKPKPSLVSYPTNYAGKPPRLPSGMVVQPPAEEMSRSSWG